MVAIPAAPGNPIVQPQAQIDFPLLALGAMVVGSGIYLLSEVDDRAAWLMTFLLLLTIAYTQRTFATELSSLLAGK